jgi:aspartate racemase
MGPIASAEFLQTIYEFNPADLEQESPACILYSDPTFPDRTDAILRGSEELLIEHLVEALENLGKMGISKIVIACVTIHYFLPKLSAQLREKIISLIDLIIEEILGTPKQHLLLCTKGTRQARIFQKYEQWSLVEQYVILPDEEEQNIIHNYIYKIKGKNNEDSIINCVNYLDKLVDKYQVNSFIAGCTEFHLVTKHLIKLKQGGKNYSIVDPLLTLAKDFRRLSDA